MAPLWLIELCNDLLATLGLLILVAALIILWRHPKWPE
jgi:hypothetical protein